MENNQIAVIKQEIQAVVSNKETMASLLQVTFKGLSVQSAQQAMLEAMLRGFKLDDFFKKNVYAIPFKDGYSLVSSIDHARKIGAKSGIVGKNAPIYELTPDGKIISCTVTVKKKTGDYIGDFTATVYFDEYSTGKQQWATKPRTMIAKVAEMHALRMACPEELAQMYTEEEYDKETVIIEDKNAEKAAKFEEQKKKLEATTTIEELQKVWIDVPGELKKDLDLFKNELKQKYATTKV